MLSSFWSCEEVKSLYLHLHLVWNSLGNNFKCWVDDYLTTQKKVYSALLNLKNNLQKIMSVVNMYVCIGIYTVSHMHLHILRQKSGRLYAKIGTHSDERLENMHQNRNRNKISGWYNYG